MIERLRGVKPRDVRKHYVDINGDSYPVKQAYSIGFALPKGEYFTSQRVAEALERLGFEVGQTHDTESQVLTDPATPYVIESTARFQSGMAKIEEGAYSANTFTPDGERRQIWFRTSSNGCYEFDHALRCGISTYSLESSPSMYRL